MVRPTNNAANQAVQRSMRLGIITDVISELRKVEWPTMQQLIRLSAMVIAISAAIGLVLGAADFVLTYVINKLYLGV